MGFESRRAPTVADAVASAREKARQKSYRKAKTLLELFPPQPAEDGGVGPQSLFIDHPADIVIYGGSAGGGKTFGTLISATKHIDVPGFGAVIFRRTMKMVKDEGGIWDESEKLYPCVGAKPNYTERYWTFPSGNVVQFAGIEHESDKYSYQGAQICEMYFEELTHFTEGQFFYLLSRNRSTCGVRPKARGTCNPEPGWVKRLLAPWVDFKFPTPAKSGETRWFVRERDQIVWVDEPPDRGKCSDGFDGKACLREHCEKCFPPEKSIAFIRASVFDNRIMLGADPGYITNLRTLPEVERKRLLDGDWDARPEHRVISSFDETVHVVPWRETKGWKLKYVFADFGKINAAELACAVDPDNGNLYIIDEDWPGYARPNFTDIADAVRKMCHGTPVNGFGGNRTGEQGWRQSYRKEGIPMEEPDPKHADPGLQYQCVDDAFQANELFVFEGCTKLIGMLNDFQHTLDDEGKPTDKFDDSKFHLCAALRYGITKLRPPKPPGWFEDPEFLKSLATR